MSELPAEVTPFAWLIGSWRGEGVGGFPTLESDFRYGEQIEFSCPGKPVLAFSSRSWSLPEQRPMSLQTGFLRPTSDTEVEVVLALVSGVVEVGYGRLADGPAGVHLEIRSDVIGHTATAKRVDADIRLFAVRGDRLMYSMDLAAGGVGPAPHLSAALERVS